MMKGIGIGKRKWLSAMTALLLCLALLPVQAGAAGAPAFSIKQDRERYELGQMVTVTVDATGLADMYGFELVIEYDAAKLRLLGAKSGLQGFSIKPIADSGRMVFAHTKTGAVSGENGAVMLSTLAFEALAEGKAAIRLVSAKLVDSKLKATQPEARAELSTSIGKPAVRLLFTDLAGHWAKANIERAADLGIAAGYADGTFRPNRSVTRAEFAAMLVRALGLNATESEGTAGSQPAAGVGPAAQTAFKDQDGIPAWALSYVKTAAASGYIKGYEDGTFRANQLITRAEMTVILTRVLNVITEPGRQTSFADRGDIPAWAEPAIAEAVAQGLVHGKGANRFAPNDSATRAEAVTLLLRTLDRQVVVADAS